MKNQTIAKEDEPEITLRNIGRRRFKIRLKSKDLTDIRNPDLVIEIVRLLALKPDATEQDFSKSTTPFNRTLALSRSWGLLDGKELTNRARALLEELDSKGGRYGYLATLLERSTLGKALLEWSGDARITSSHSSRVKEFLGQRFPQMKKETRDRRAGAISKLISTLAPHHPSNRILEADSKLSAQDGFRIAEEPYFETRIIDAIDRAKIGTKVLRIPTGFMSAQGYDMVARNLEGTNIRILLGKKDERGRKILADPLNNFGKSVRSGIPSQHKKGAHRRLYKELVEGTTRVRKAQSRMIDDLHGKGFFGDRRWAIPTSANLSRAGLEKNIETAYTITKSDDVDYYVNKFDGLWEEGEEITADIIEEIVESWVFQRPVIPYHAYLRGLNEVYGNLASQDLGELYELAAFQKMVVGSTIRSLKDRNAALVISPTGTGKTVMGSYILAALRSKFEKSVVIVPNADLIGKWKRDCLSFGINPLIITHKKLQTEMESFRNTSEGEHLEMFIDEKTLVIIDEAHKFRTESSLGHIMLDSILSGNFNGKKPAVLLLTATPIGTGFENLQRLYELTNLGEAPKSAEELRDTPGFVNVTLPFIMKRFGLEDKDGNLCLSFGRKKKYYARRHQMIVPFNDGNEEIYRAIRDLDFRELRDGVNLDSFGLGIEYATVDQMNFNRIGLADAVRSSEAAAIARIDNQLEKIDERRFLDPKKTRMQLLELKRLVIEQRSNIIYEYALKILKSKNRKTIINVWHRKTRMYLVQRLRKDLGKKIVEYSGTTAEKKRIREKFAPKANGVKVAKRNQIDILVASGGASEGHDLQDAEAILNYDLWWTPLMLQQRMGRLDRPTDKPREFSVLNLVNMNDYFTNLVTMDEKLRERAGELKGIIADGAYEAMEDRDWHKMENAEFGVLSAEMESEESDLEIVTTSQHIADLADATREDIDFANSLPPGFISAYSGDQPGTFVMISHGSDIYTAFLHEDNIASYAPGDQTYEKLLGHIRSEKGDLPKTVPEDLLESVELLTSGICKKNRLDCEEIVTIFSVAVLEHDTID